MNFIHALRLNQIKSNLVISFIGSGGKTTALFQLARQLPKQKPVIVTATSHLGTWQTSLADHHLIVTKPGQVELPANGIVLVTGPVEKDKTRPVSSETLYWLRAKSQELNAFLLIEADGSRQKPLKAPAEHEPPIPEFSDVVIHITGLMGLHKPLTEEFVHRPEIFSRLSGLVLGDPITQQGLFNLLTHPQGGLKNIPPQAQQIAMLNQADTDEMKSVGGNLAHKLLSHYDSVIVGSLQQESFHTLERTAGIILAAGKSSRYGQPKQLLDWKGQPFIRQVTETALHAALDPVIVVTGHHHTEIESHLQNLPIHMVHNPNYEQGQSTSVRAGILALPPNTGSVIFLLADQPQIPAAVIRALAEAHSAELQPILAPLVLEEKRANPVLFDQITFNDLLQLQGDVGGRAIFDKYPVSYLPWHDDILLLDVDKPEDYTRLKNLESGK